MFSRIFIPFDALAVLFFAATTGCQSPNDGALTGGESQLGSVLTRATACDVDVRASLDLATDPDRRLGALTVWAVRLPESYALLIVPKGEALTSTDLADFEDVTLALDPSLSKPTSLSIDPDSPRVWVARRVIRQVGYSLELLHRLWTLTSPAPEREGEIIAADLPCAIKVMILSPRNEATATIESNGLPDVRTARIFVCAEEKDSVLAWPQSITQVFPAASNGNEPTNFVSSLRLRVVNVSAKLRVEVNSNDSLRTRQYFRFFLEPRAERTQDITLNSSISKKPYEIYLYDVPRRDTPGAEEKVFLWARSKE